MNTLIKNNILVANFLGWDETRPNYFIQPFTETNVCCITDFKFNTSWNWLMVAVKKCLTITCEFELHEWDLSIAETLRSVDTTIVFDEVVEFIKWFTKAEIHINKNFMNEVEFDKLNSLDLRSDIENNNIFDTILKPQGYVGNRPSDFTGEFHEDDTWAIDCFTSDRCDVSSYLYVSEFEYNEDVKLLSNYLVVTK